ncbi:RnfH family protein [Bordetella sp. 02P26C-1]|uniref:RnfH family protein n=1 Tax=Bordetella sp. 02P26C-1 TaxID=2683195 RepID=UPI0013532C42|nr:RnfH family protein [Bordetella sp. 02P26C-1]MVW79922.1 RnfH family protein [Bordetella sp. 02P26C-1]
MASEPDTVRVLVCYPTPDSAWAREVTLPAGATVRQAMIESGFAQAFPTLDPWKLGVGIFGKQCQADTPLSDGDRVEVYRELTFDPMVSRRRRAEHRRALAAARTGRERPAGLL